MAVSFRRLGTLITSPIRGRFRSAPYQNHHTSSSSRACMSFHFGINGQIRRSHISFLQRSAHRLLVQPYLIRSTNPIYRPCLCSISLTQWGALKDRGTIRRGSILGELQNRYAINSSSNNIHGTNAISTPRQCLASPALLHDENRRGQLDRSRS